MPGKYDTFDLVDHERWGIALQPTDKGKPVGPPMRPVTLLKLDEETQKPVGKIVLRSCSAAAAYLGVGEVHSRLGAAKPVKGYLLRVALKADVLDQLAAVTDKTDPYSEALALPEKKTKKPSRTKRKKKTLVATKSNIKDIPEGTKVNVPIEELLPKTPATDGLEPIPVVETVVKKKSPTKSKVSVDDLAVLSSLIEAADTLPQTYHGPLKAKQKIAKALRKLATKEAEKLGIELELNPAPLPPPASPHQMVPPSPLQTSPVPYAPPVPVPMLPR